MADKYVSSNQFFIGVQRILNLMNGKIGDVALNTTDQTINGAINENVSSIKELKNKIDKIQTGGGGSSPSVDLSNYPKRTELSAVATSGNYNDLNNKPTIPSISGLASETFVITKINEAKLNGVEIDLTPYAKTAELSNVAKTGSYNDLTDKPNIPSMPTLSTVATSGDYNDLNNKPTIPSISGLASETFVITKINEAKLNGVEIDLTPYAKTAELSNVAKTGSYNDLTDKPNIPSMPTLSTVATSGDYNDLNNKPTIPSISGLASEAFVKNAINEAKLNGSGSDIDLSIYAKTADLSTVAKSGSYIDLTDKPYIPSDPDLTPYAKTEELSNVAKTGSYNDLTNKPYIPNIPALSTVATSGDYNDLNNKPNILTEDQVISIVNSQLGAALNDALNAEY